MDNQNPPLSDPGGNAQSAVPSQDMQHQQVPQPVSPVSGGHKEYAPIPVRTEAVSHSPAESSPQIPNELRELGIEASPDTAKPDISPAAQQAGVQPVKTAAPVLTAPSAAQPAAVLPTPMSYQQAVTNLKAHKSDESVSWLSMLSKYVLEKIGMQNAS
jgi:hypothetical protein